MNTEKMTICQALRAYVNKHPGFDPANYDRAGYLADSRLTQRQRRDALQLLRSVELRDGLTAETLKQGFRAFSGRLTWNGSELSYCAGQYHCTEYRAAVCAVLASALWAHIRENAMPEPVIKQHGSAEALPMSTEYKYDGMSAGEWLRRYFRREFGRGITSRWF